MSIARVSDAVGRWFAVIVLAAGAIALALPGPFVGWAPAVPWLLSLIMLGMGMTLRPVDFAIVAKRPVALIIGVVAQFAVMPLLAWAIANLFGLPPMLAAGMILLGAVPGGTASNVMVYLARGDVALSVAMTSVSTLLAPLMTPLLMLIYLGEDLPVAAGDLFVSIVQMVMVPVLLGLVLRRIVPRVVERILPVLPLVSVAGITAVVCAVVAGSASTILSAGVAVMLAVVVHNAGGLGVGYALGKVCGQPVSTRRAISIEVGMQNSGLATALATVHFAPAAALPGALAAVWHNISGPILAGYWSRRPVPGGDRRDRAEAPAVNR